MGGLLDKPKTVKPPPVPAPPPTPTVDEEVGDVARRRRPRGRQEAFLTGALEPSEEQLGLLRTGRKKRLGG